jgi:ribosomal protein S18 acetylase RimI-like enzyme
MEIRKAKHTDVPKLKELWIEFMDHHGKLDPDYVRSDDAEANWVNYINSKFESEIAVVFVANNNAGLAGYIGVLIREYPPIFTVKKYGFVEEIAVTADQRRQGIASRLWSAAEEWLLSRGISTIRVNIDVANPESQGFFRSLGFSDDTETLLKKY